MKPKILAFAGSLRKESFNKKLLRVAAQTAEVAGAQVTVIDLRDFQLPVFDQDLETPEGLPAQKKLKKLFMDHQGFLFACPEYNSSIAPVLKNTIDWVSRALLGESPLACYNGKVAALLSSSPGALGGLRGLVHVRSILSNIGVLVLPDQLALPKAHEAFDANGALKDAKQLSAISAISSKLVQTISKLYV